MVIGSLNLLVRSAISSPSLRRKRVGCWKCRSLALDFAWLACVELIYKASLTEGIDLGAPGSPG